MRVRSEHVRIEHKRSLCVRRENQQYSGQELFKAPSTLETISEQILFEPCCVQRRPDGVAYTRFKKLKKTYCFFKLSVSHYIVTLWSSQFIKCLNYKFYSVSYTHLDVYKRQIIN